MEIKWSPFPSAEICLENKGAGGRDSGLTLATGQVDVWAHYQAQPDTLVAFDPAKMLEFVQQHCGKSGIRYKCGMGDGRRASGYIVPLRTITGLGWVRTIPNFSGTYVTGDNAVVF